MTLCSEGLDAASLFTFCAATSWLLNRAPVHCTGFAVGMTIRVQGRGATAFASSVSAQAKSTTWPHLWKRMEPTFYQFLSDRHHAGYIKIACDNVNVEFERIGRQFLGASVVEIVMVDRFGRPSAVVPVTQRRQATSPILSLAFSAIAQPQRSTQKGSAEAALRRATARALKCAHKPVGQALQALPVAVRYRTSGAMQAWNRVYRLVAIDVDVPRSLADPRCSPMTVGKRVKEFLRSHGALDACLTDRIVGTGHLAASVVWHAFWARGAMLYEPTDALQRVFNCSEIGARVPIASIIPMVPALAVSMLSSERYRRDGIEAISVFLHRAVAQDADATRPSEGTASSEAEAPVIGIQLWSRDPSDADEVGKSTMHCLQLVIDDPSQSILDAVNAVVDKAFAGAFDRQPRHSRGSVRSYQALAQRWKDALLYLAKLLLYLGLADAEVREERVYSDTLRTVAGLSRCQRAASHAKIAKLYDRTHVGPAVLCEPLPSAGGVGGTHPLRVLWRRGQFRMQSYGEQHSKQRVRFDWPMVIRGDDSPSSES